MLAQEQAQGLDPAAHVQLLERLLAEDRWSDAQSSAERLVDRLEAAPGAALTGGASPVQVLRRLDRADLLVRIEPRVTLAAQDAVWLTQSLHRSGDAPAGEAAARRALQQLEAIPEGQRDIETDLALFELHRQLEDSETLRTVVQGLEQRHLGNAAQRRDVPLDDLVSLWEAFDRTGFDEPTQRLVDALIERMGDLAASPRTPILSRVTTLLRRSQNGADRQRVLQAVDEVVVRPNIETGVALPPEDLAALSRLYVEFSSDAQRAEDLDFALFVARSASLPGTEMPSAVDSDAVARIVANHEDALTVLSEAFDGAETSRYTGQILAAAHARNGTQAQWLDTLDRKLATAASSTERVNLLLLRAHSVKWQTANGHPPRLSLRVLRSELDKALAAAETDADRLAVLGELVDIPRRGAHHDQALRLIDALGSQISDPDVRAQMATVRAEILDEQNRRHAFDQEHKRRVTERRLQTYRDVQARRAQRDRG